MKIIFVDNSLWGQLNFRGEVIFHFRDQGHEVILVSPIDQLSLDMKKTVPDGIRHINLSMQRSGTNPINDAKYFCRLRAIYRKEKPDYVFHVTIKPNIYGTLAARTLGIKSAAMVAGLGFAFSGTGLSSTVGKTLYRLALRGKNKVFVLNEDNAKVLVGQKIVNQEQLVLLKGGEGIDLSKYPCIDNATAPATFLMVARMLYDKGYREAVDAVRIVQKTYPDIKLQLLGPVDEAYPNAVSKKQIEADEIAGLVTYLGCTNEPIEIMGKPGVLLLLLSSYREGLNRSLMEGCALGKPIITSDIPGCRECVKDGENGFLVPPKDYGALAGAMLHYLSLNEGQRREMSRKSRQLAEERFDIKYVIAEYDKILTL